jgi:hypothetical protein
MSGTKFTFQPEPYERVSNLKYPFGLNLTKDIGMDLYVDFESRDFKNTTPLAC